MRSRGVPIVGLGVILAVVLVVTLGGPDNADDSGTDGVAAAAATPSTSGTTPAEPALASSSSTSIPSLGAAPELEGIDGWLQTDITSLDDLRGSVVVLQFWTFGCFNCKNTIPHLQELAAAHADDDFEIVGVHSPEFTYEEDPVAVEQAAGELGVSWPIALDTKQKSFFGWQGSPAYWPRTYVIDRDGEIRFDHIGEGAYDELGEVVAALLETS